MKKIKWRNGEGDIVKEFGDEIKRRLSNPIATKNGKGENFHLTFKKPTRINHICLMEEIANGERVREFMVEGYSEEKWKKFSQGTCIGHKRIEQFEPIMVSEVRLTITQSIAKPLIRNFSVYYIE